MVHPVMLSLWNTQGWDDTIRDDISPLGALLLVVDAVAGDGGGVGAGRLPGEGDEPRAGDDGLEVGGRPGDRVARHRGQRHEAGAGA